MNENLTDERFENLMEMFENIPNDINIPKEYAKHEINDVYHNYEFIKIDYSLDCDIPENKEVLEKAIIINLQPDELDGKLEEISKEEIKPPFTYRILPPTKYWVNGKKWEEYYERPIGDFFWLVVQKVTKCDRFDAYISQLKIEQEKEIREYFFSIGWNFELTYYEEHEVINFKFYEIMPEYVINDIII
jgi:hypothetical protein